MSEHHPFSGGWIGCRRSSRNVRIALAVTLTLMTTLHSPPSVAAQGSYPLVLVAALDATGPKDAGDAAAPGAVSGCPFQAPETFRRLLATIWERSHTFRRQCARLLVEPALRARLFVGSSYTQTRGRAATLLMRTPTGLQAEVHIAGGSVATAVVELIGHELEHVIEQLDGVDLAGIARRAPATVWLSGPDSYETRRAIQAGRLVAAEFTMISH